MNSQRTARRAPTQDGFNAPRKLINEYAGRMDETLGFLLWDTTRAFNYVTALMLTPHGLGGGLYHFLRILREQDGLTFRELSDQSRVRSPTTVEAIRELEQRGFVRRERNAKDARKVNVFLTPQAHRLFDRVLPTTVAINRRGMKGLSQSDRRTLKRLLRQVRANMISERDRTKYDPYGSLNSMGTRSGRRGKVEVF